MTMARAELEAEIATLVPDSASAERLRKARLLLKKLLDAHGPHPSLVRGIQRIQARIAFVELNGANGKEN